MFKSNYFQTAGPKDIECSLPTQDGPEINSMHRWIQPLTSRSWYLLWNQFPHKTTVSYKELNFKKSFGEIGLKVWLFSLNEGRFLPRGAFFYGSAHPILSSVEPVKRKWIYNRERMGLKVRVLYGFTWGERTGCRNPDLSRHGKPCQDFDTNTKCVANANKDLSLSLSLSSI